MRLGHYGPSISAPLQGPPGPFETMHYFRSIHEYMTKRPGGCPRHTSGGLRARWRDALQRKDSDAAIESFWRCKFVEV